jgi:hypothetical protein
MAKLRILKLKACHTTHALSVHKSLYEQILEKSFFNMSIEEWYNKYNVIDVYFSKEILKHNRCFVPLESHTALVLSRSPSKFITQTRKYV